MLRDILKLYLITNRNKKISNIEFLDLIEQAILGGVTSIQLREKNLEFEKFLNLATSCKEITEKYNVPLFINDNLVIAKKISAYGVHVGQSDSSLQNAREYLGTNFIIGISINNLTQLRDKQNEYADYLSIGPIFPTSTKSDAEKPIGIEAIPLLTRNKSKPMIAIGGITLDNIHTLMNSELDGFAISSAIFNHINPILRAKKFKLTINKAI
ncbi:MAG: thiamine phosphate synthase [Rickettsiales bacterium]|jgi:thiamine-phosphate diphosphorylase|nr:thiamine phosphate synthase [Rickettsiales bacterium]